MGQFIDALIALGIFAAWCLIVAIWFRQSFTTSRWLQVGSGITAFFVISLLLHLLGVTGRQILDVISWPIIAFFELLDRAFAFVLGIFGATMPFDLSNWASHLWDAFVNFLIFTADLAGEIDGGPAFVANLGLVIFYLFLRSAVVSVLTLLIWIGTRAFALGAAHEEEADREESQEDTSVHRFEAKGHSWWFDNPSVKFGALSLYRVVVAVLTICLLLAVWAALRIDLQAQTGGSTSATKELPDVVKRFTSYTMSLYWAGLLILTGEIASAVRIKSRFERWIDKFWKKPQAQEIDKLKGLYGSYSNELGDPKWLEAFSFSPDPKLDDLVDDTEAESWSEADSKELLDLFKSERLSRLKLGVLTSADFEQMAELIQITKDSGGTTLIICPQSQNLDERQEVNQYDDISTLVRENIKDAMGATVYDVTQNHYMLRDRREAAGIDYSVLIGSEFEMADVLSRKEEDSAYEALIKVRSIILLEFQRLDTGVLALQLQRLRRAALNKNFAVFCQSDAREGLPSTLANLFQDGSNEAFVSQTMRKPHLHHRYWLLWRFTEGLMDRLGSYTGLTESKRKLPLFEAMPLLILPSWREKTSVSIYDPYGRILLKDWRSKWLDAVQKFAAGPFRALRRQLDSVRPFGLFRTRDLGQVIFQEDHGNLYEVLQRYRDFERDGNHMVHVVSSWYPMRDYMFAHLAGSRGEKHDIRPADAFLPIQARPANGPKQVAISLYDALAHDTVVSYSRVEYLMQEMSQEPAPRLLKSMGATASKRGVELLFHRVLGFKEELSTFIEKGSREAGLSFTNPTLAPDFYLARVIWRSADAERIIARVHAGDYGLNYSRGTYLPIGRNMFRVTKIEGIKEPIEVDTVITVEQNEYHERGFKARPKVQFCRNYRLLSEIDLLAGTQFEEEAKDYPAILIEEGMNSFPGPGGSGARLVHLSFERETFGRYMYENTVPFGASQEQNCEGVSHPNRTDSDGGFKIKRIHQPALVLSYVNEGGGNQTANRGKAAFSLAVTLNDVIATLFPKDAYRLAIVSPQAGLLHAKMRNPENLGNTPQTKQVSAYVELAYPQYLAPPQDPNSPIANVDWSRQFGDIFKDGRYRLHNLANLNEQDTTFSSRRIDLLALEDAGLDLGLARAVFDNWRNIETHWRGYLGWLAKSKGASNPYAFGTDQLPPQFDFEAALEWLKE